MFIVMLILFTLKKNHTRMFHAFLASSFNWELLPSRRSYQQHLAGCMIEHKARHMPNGARTNNRRCAIFGPWADENHICFPFCGGVYYLKLRMPLAEQ